MVSVAIVEAEAQLGLFFREALDIPASTIRECHLPFHGYLLDKTPQGITGEAGARSAVRCDSGAPIIVLF